VGYAVITRYLAPTNSRGTRISATGPAVTMEEHAAGRLTRATVPWDYAGGPGASHRAAAEAVAAKLRAAGWPVRIAPADYGASLPDESGRVFILEHDRG
jgi:hypothetical protein